MLSILAILVFILILLGLGRPFVVRLDAKRLLNEGERLAFSFAIGCLVVNFCIFFIVPYRFDALAMWILIGALALLALPGLKHVPWNIYSDSIAAEYRSSLYFPWNGLLWLIILGVAALTILQGMAPPSDYDSLMYHLMLPRYDLEVGHSAVPWDRAFPQILFPSLGGNLTRLALATMNDGVAQMMHGMLGALATLATGLLSLRLGFSKNTSLMAALFFLVFRAVIWQMATVEVEPPLAAFSCLALLGYVVWRQQKAELGPIILFGLMIGAAILTKMIGFAIALSFAGLIIYDLIKKPRSFLMLLMGPLTALLVYAPHAIKSIIEFGNPIMPLFNNIFNPEYPEFLETLDSAYGTGRGLIDLITAPWLIFVQPMHYFDGMVAGSPYLLVLAPLALIDRDKFRHWLPALSFVGIFVIFWFWFLSQQVRFLIPIVPVLAGVAACGWAAMWKASANSTTIRSMFIAVSIILGLNQAMFVGVYAMIRLPAAFGLVSIADYHENTPTMRGDLYKTCSYIRDNLKNGEKYYSMIQPHSYYCPQTSAVRIYFPDEAMWWLTSKTPPQMPLEKFISRAEKTGFKFYLVPGLSENKRNPTAKPILEETDYNEIRSGSYLGDAISNLKPLIKSIYASVYDGDQVLNQLRKMK